MPERESSAVRVIRSVRLTRAVGISQKVLTKLRQRLPSSECGIGVQLSKRSSGYFQWKGNEHFSASASRAILNKVQMLSYLFW